MDGCHSIEGQEIVLLRHQREVGGGVICLIPSAHILPRIGLAAALNLKDR